jgi:hypothetical protein
MQPRTEVTADAAIQTTPFATAGEEKRVVAAAPFVEPRPTGDRNSGAGPPASPRYRRWRATSAQGHGGLLPASSSSPRAFSLPWRP